MLPIKNTRPFRLILLILALLLSGCDLSQFIPTLEPEIPTPVIIPTLRRPTQTLIPSATPTITPIPTRSPLPGLSGQIYFTLIDRTSSTPAPPVLAYLPAGCLDCPAPQPVPGFQNTTGSPPALVWSADGRYAAYTSASAQGQQPAVRLYNPADSSWKTLSELAHLGPEVFWSPDSQWLAFQGQAKNQMDLYIVHPDGSGLKNLTKGGLFSLQTVVLSGWLDNQLVFTGGGKGGYFAYVVGLTNNLPRRRSNVPIFSGYDQDVPPVRPSPDGQWMAYTEKNGLVGAVMGMLSLKEGAGSHPVAAFKDGNIDGYTWSPKGDWLAFWVSINDQSEVYVVHPDGSEYHMVYSAPAIRSVIFDLHNSGYLLIELSADPARLVLAPIGTGQPQEINAADESSASWEGASWRP